MKLSAFPPAGWRGRVEASLWVPGDEAAFREVLAALAEEQSPVPAASAFDRLALVEDIELLQSSFT